MRKERLANAQNEWRTCFPIYAPISVVDFRRSISQFHGRTCASSSFQPDKVKWRRAFAARVYGRAVTIDIRAPYARQAAQGQGPRRSLHSTTCRPAKGVYLADPPSSTVRFTSLAVRTVERLSRLSRRTARF